MLLFFFFALIIINFRISLFYSAATGMKTCWGGVADCIGNHPSKVTEKRLNQQELLSLKFTLGALAKSQWKHAGRELPLTLSCLSLTSEDFWNFPRGSLSCNSCSWLGDLWWIWDFIKCSSIANHRFCNAIILQWNVCLYSQIMPIYYNNLHNFNFTFLSALRKIQITPLKEVWASGKRTLVTYRNKVFTFLYRRFHWCWHQKHSAQLSLI